MRLFYISSAAIAVVISLTSTTVDAFSINTEKIKKAGAGVPVQSSGDFCLYDPNEQGKLQGTNDLMDRISSGSSFTLAPPQTIIDLPPTGAEVKDAQHFLEHLDSNGDLPLNFAKPQSPVTATVLGRTKLITDDAPGDIEHVIMKLPDGFHYVEGKIYL